MHKKAPVRKRVQGGPVVHRLTWEAVERSREAATAARLAALVWRTSTALLRVTCGRPLRGVPNFAPSTDPDKSSAGISGARAGEPATDFGLLEIGEVPAPFPGFPLPPPLAAFNAQQQQQDHSD